MDHGDPTAQEVLEGNNISKWARGLFCDILAKNAAVFCPCPKDMPEADLESNGLISKAEKTARQPNIDSVVCSLVVTLTQVYNEKANMEKNTKCII